jgi:hypothetical protein
VDFSPSLYVFHLSVLHFISASHRNSIAVGPNPQSAINLLSSLHVPLTERSWIFVIIVS